MAAMPDDSDSEMPDVAQAKELRPEEGEVNIARRCQEASASIEVKLKAAPAAISPNKMAKEPERSPPAKSPPSASMAAAKPAAKPPPAAITPLTGKKAAAKPPPASKGAFLQKTHEVYQADPGTAEGFHTHVSC